MIADRPNCFGSNYQRAPNPPEFVRPRLGRPRSDPTQTGLCKFGWVWSLLKLDNCRYRTETDFNLGGRFGYFSFFLLRGGEGARSVSKGVGGVGFLLKMPGGGVLAGERRRGGRGVGRVSAGNWGGGYFFFGAEMPTKLIVWELITDYRYRLHNSGNMIS